MELGATYWQEFSGSECVYFRPTEILKNGNYRGKFVAYNGRFAAKAKQTSVNNVALWTRCGDHLPEKVNKRFMGE